YRTPEKIEAHVIENVDRLLREIIEPARTQQRAERAKMEAGAGSRKTIHAAIKGVCLNVRRVTEKLERRPCGSPRAKNQRLPKRTKAEVRKRLRICEFNP